MSGTQTVDANVQLAELARQLREAQDELAAERKAREAAEARKVGAFSLKVTDKGCVGVRGIRGVNVGFGLNLYPTAFQDIFAHKAEIERFIDANRAKLSWGRAEGQKPAIASK